MNILNLNSLTPLQAKALEVMQCMNPALDITACTLLRDVKGVSYRYESANGYVLWTWTCVDKNGARVYGNLELEKNNYIVRNLWYLTVGALLADLAVLESEFSL